MSLINLWQKKGMQRMANSFKLDVRYTHSSIMGVYAANLIFLQLFIISQAKSNGKKLLYKILTWYKAPFLKQSKKSILSTSFSSYIQEVELKKKAPFGVQGEVYWHLLTNSPVNTSLWRSGIPGNWTTQSMLLNTPMFSLHHAFILL